MPATVLSPPAEDSAALPRAGRGRDLLLALALALGAVGLYLATGQRRLTIDGAGLAGRVLLERDQGYYNVLYLPLVRVVGGLWPGALDLDAVRGVHALFGGLAVGAAFLFARGLGAAARWSALAAVLWATSPGLWFYATTIETHAVHAGVAALVLVGFLALPWRRPWPALAGASLLTLPLFWTQQVSLLLGPGLVGLVALARARAGRAFPRGILLLRVGPALLAGFVVALLAANLWRHGTLTPSVGGQLEQIAFDHSLADTWWTEWLRPLGLLGPLAFVGLALSAPRARWAFFAALAPTALYFSWWGVDERGGYLLGSGGFYVALAATAAGAFPRVARERALLWAGASVLLALQAGLGWRTLATHDVGWDPAARVVAVREAVGEDGLLLATASIAPPLAIALPRSEELQVWEACKQLLVLGGGEASTAALAPRLFRRVDAAHSAHRSVAYELGWSEAERRGKYRAYHALLADLEQRLRARYRVELQSDPHWPLLVLHPRGTDAAADDAR